MILQVKLSILINEQSHEKICFLHRLKNKGTDELYGNHAADQHLCFCLKDRTIPLLPKSKISSVVVVQPALCQIWLETPRNRFSRNAAQIWGKQPYFLGGSTLALIFRKSWFITARFLSIHLRA